MPCSRPDPYHEIRLAESPELCSLPESAFGQARAQQYTLQLDCEGTFELDPNYLGVSNLEDILRVYTSGPSLHSYPWETWRNLVNIESIMMRDHSFESAVIPLDTFDSLERLVSLHIMDSHLTCFEAVMPMALEVFDLLNNKITEFNLDILPPSLRVWKF